MLTSFWFKIHGLGAYPERASEEVVDGKKESPEETPTPVNLVAGFMGLALARTHFELGQ